MRETEAEDRHGCDRCAFTPGSPRPASGGAMAPTAQVIGTAAGPGMGATRVSSSGTTARVAVWASAPVFQRQFLAVLNGGRPVPVPTVSAARHLTVSFDGSSYRYQGPRSAPAGPLEVRLADRSPVPLDSFWLVIGKLLHGGRSPMSKRSSAAGPRPACPPGSKSQPASRRRRTLGPPGASPSGRAGTRWCASRHGMVPSTGSPR
jgi:hypothetical protein